MRHRARRSVLDRLHGLAAAHRGAAVVVALVTATAATGVALTVPDSPESSRTGSSVVAGDAPSSDPDQTPGSPSTLSPSDSATREARASREASPSAPQPTRADDRVSRSTDRALPTDDAGGVSPSTPSAPSPEPTPAETESPAADAPQTTATTRSANASRWVIGVGSDAEATYECSLDGGAYQPCDSTVTYDGLDRGTHSFAARATDGDGDTDPSPATLTAEIGPRGQG